MRCCLILASAVLAQNILESPPDDILNIVGAIEESLTGPSPVEMIVFHSPMAKQIRHMASLFGVEGFDYLHWVITNHFQDILTSAQSDDELIDAHFNVLVPETARETFNTKSETFGIPLSHLKQAVVGVLVNEARPLESKEDHLDVYDHIMNVGLRISGPLLASVTEDVYNSMYSDM